MMRTQNRRKFTVRDDQCAVTYGPALAENDGWVLTTVTDDDVRVELVFPESPMYRLWTEVRGVPSPTADHPAEHDRLVQQVLQLANDADSEMLREAKRALGGKQ